MPKTEPSSAPTARGNSRVSRIILSERITFQVANDDATASAGEGVVFKIGTAGKVYIAYDDENIDFPVRSSPTGFSKTKDKILIGGRPHTIYRSGQMNGGELTDLGTNSWTEQPPAGLNNYVVFYQSRGRKAWQRSLVSPLSK
jgi:hypothetical protein